MFIGLFEFDWLKKQIKTFMEKNEDKDRDEIDLNIKNDPLIAKGFKYLLEKCGLLRVLSCKLLQPVMCIDNGGNMANACKKK